MLVGGSDGGGNAYMRSLGFGVGIIGVNGVGVFVYCVLVRTYCQRVRIPWGLASFREVFIGE